MFNVSLFKFSQHPWGWRSRARISHLKRNLFFHQVFPTFVSLLPMSIRAVLLASKRHHLKQEGAHRTTCFTGWRNHFTLEKPHQNPLLTVGMVRPTYVELSANKASAPGSLSEVSWYFQRWRHLLPGLVLQRGRICSPMEVPMS